MKRPRPIVAMSAVAAALLAAGSVPALAQATLNEAIAGRAQSGSGQDRLLVDAKEIVYDNDRNTIAASGDVQMNYQGRTLQANRVTYDRNTGRVFAEGNARLTESNGTFATGDRFELTDDFRNGFIDSLRVVQTTVEQGRPLTTRFSAPRAERAEGETTTFERGTYTACEPCKDNPERPPLWQVKAAKIIHNNSERTIYYEDASLELLGIPVAYLPYFWTPDPTVKRKTGFLSPQYVYSTSIGYGATVPFFWAIAPNYDLTISPTFLSRQGVLVQAEWRHRLETGAYDIRAAGINQLDSDAFSSSPYGTGDRDWRGSLETKGEFFINQNWRWGWDITLVSDKLFLNNYNIRNNSLSSYYLKEATSTVYLQGQGDRSFFDMRGYYFQTLSSSESQKQQPVVAPVIDYNRRFTPSTIGGEFALDVNVTSLSREAAQFESTTSANSATYGLYGTCAAFSRASCLVRGISGSMSRASVMASWRREFIDPAGQVWTPFAYVRADAYSVSQSLSGYQNAQLSNFFSSEDSNALRLMPAVGLEYRYPFIAPLGTSSQQILEPIAQIIARPNETRIGNLPNEDAQSLVFDDTSLFDWDKFSGYDRAEGGVRANVGVQYTVTGADDFYASVLFGQSYQLAGQNSFSVGDSTNVGLDSGLETDQSDYVGRFQISPNRNFTFITRGRFDESTFAPQRIEATATANFAPYFPLTTSLTYARYAAQPDIGYEYRREGVLASAEWNLTPNWSLNGSVLLDLDNYLETSSATSSYDWQDVAYVSALKFGAAYLDECMRFSVQYSMTPNDDSGNASTSEWNKTLMFTLELRSLGDVNASHSLSDD